MESLGEAHFKNRKGQDCEFHDNSTNKQVTKRSQSEKYSPPYIVILFFV